MSHHSGQSEREMPEDECSIHNSKSQADDHLMSSEEGDGEENENERESGRKSEDYKL